MAPRLSLGGLEEQNHKTAPPIHSLDLRLAPRPAARPGTRPPLSFRSVNRTGFAGYDPGLQRHHHLLPLQLLARNCFSCLFAEIDRKRVGFDDFRRNGLLLPCSDRTAVLMGLPLHRGPHRRYNGMVIERVGQIETTWSAMRQHDPDKAGTDALYRLSLLQSALRRRLLDPSGRPMALNRADPALRQPDFTDLDAMADLLFGSTPPVPQARVPDRVGDKLAMAG